MKRSIATQVRDYMAFMGEDFTPAKLAEAVALHQRDLPPEKRCKRQNIESLLERDFQTVRYLIPLAKAMGATAEELGNGDFRPGGSADSTPIPAPVGVPVSQREEPPEGYVRLPVMCEASAGPGRTPQLETVQPVDVLESYIRQKLKANPRNLKVLTARGGSMTGLIEDGDIMFVEPTSEFTDDGIYILTLDDLIRVKRLSVSMATGNVLIESNDGRKSEELPLREVPGRLHIQGRVLGAWSLRSFA